MLPDRAALQPRFAALAAGVMLLIVYGSLFPFQFQSCGGSLLSTSAAPANRGDLLSNILLYMPLGFFATKALRNSRTAVLLATLAGAALSFAMESLQICDAGRVPSMADVYANAGGALLGSLLAVACGSNFGAAALLALCWIGSRTLPYVPSLRPEKYRSAIRTLLFAPPPIEVFHYFALWLAAAAAFEALRPRWGLIIAIGAVIVARIIVLDLSIVPAEILGATLALIAWNFMRRTHAAALAAVVVVGLYVTVNALQPFHFLAHPRRFTWTPFLSFMRDSRENASRVFLEKSFMYGSLVWLAARAGLSFRLATILAAALVFALRLTQIYLPGRSAEVTDPLMVLLAAVTIRALGE